ncbi:hypothetical protein LINPERPRIM_LOCUS32965 [Linum perenne]
MMKTLSTYTATAKTAEIMSRYRPIAPKPDSPSDQKIRQSPYLRDLWPQLQARPTRTRKRSRGALSPPVIKRPRTQQMFTLPLKSPPPKHLSMQGFLPVFSQLPPLQNLDNSVITAPSSLPTLSLLPPSVTAATEPEVSRPPYELIRCMKTSSQERELDLNTVVVDVPEEKDLLRQLQEPRFITNVISPQPVRPVGSSIRVGCINENPNAPPVQAPKKAEQVEEEVESDLLPAVISDSNNKVRLANSAYKEMVGEPECSWLNSMVTTSNGSRLGCSSSSSCCKRICGQVSLHFADSRVPVSSNGFSCWVSIDWGSQGKKSSVNAFCDVMRLACESNNYLFTWRFHTPARHSSKTTSPCLDN